MKWLIFIAVMCSTLAQAASPLPQLAANRESLTVSGLSSGAYMAVQYQVAHSQNVQGAGIIAGGPYYCAKGQVARALSHCMTPTPAAQPPSLDQQERMIDQLAREGRIDNPEHLRRQRVWMFSGGSDQTVQRSVMDALAGFYRARMPETAIRYVQHPAAGHAMPSVEPGSTGACEHSESPFINRCEQLDAAGELLAHLLGPLKAKRTKPEGQLMRFDQGPFLSGKPVDASMAEEGYVYIPKDCPSGGCRIHVVFHGCRQSTEEIGIRFVTDAGYNGWADSNRIIVLYPQIRSRNGPALGSWKYVMNPKGCWDWWGYSGANYHTKAGVQIKAVAGMIEQLAKPVLKSP
ncbi:MAG: poly(3-hydroxybutyrate) depolymerase [Rhodocyclaceae bacterium]|nr:poly(3-hydroxybutyrate) depolymerase [Rhodocyclaceae bacterium]MDZ4214131.1 poly(3-hydroxybutyrate) depolymerase [Rhodocyclaceae bacterium]